MHSLEQYGITHVHRSDGICHQLMTEAGYVKPGDVAFGTDSHTTTYGCVGAFSTGIGYTEMASPSWAPELIWVQVPETIKVVIDGELPENVMSKDVILRLIGDLGADGATYQCPGVLPEALSKSMTVASRMTIANMAIEAGAKCALFTPDEKTAEYCEITWNDYQKSLVRRSGRSLLPRDAIQRGRFRSGHGVSVPGGQDPQCQRAGRHRHRPGIHRFLHQRPPGGSGRQPPKF